MALQNVFIDLELHDIVPLYPWQLNNELYLNLKKNLIKKREKKCIGAGYICKINNIIKYDGYVIPEDLTGDVTFNVTYNAKVCVPIVGTQIVAKIEQIIKLVIMVVNGPISGIIKFADLNNNIFTINDANEIIHKKTNTPLKIGDHVKMIVKSKRSYNGETNIGVLGFINDIATADEIKANMYVDYDDIDNNMNDINDMTENYIEMNDDDETDALEPQKNKNYTMEI